MPKVVILVQARMGSTRFPKKMMVRLQNRPIIEWVLKRCEKSKYADNVVLATSSLIRDDELADYAQRLGFKVYRGDELDVLGRFANTIKKYPADIIVRVCGDRPLIDPSLIDMAISYYNSHDFDLVYNHISGDGQNWPRGFGVEVFSKDLLLYMHETQFDDYSKEHVTPYIWKNQNKYNVSAVPIKDWKNLEPDMRFDLDDKQDLIKLESIPNLSFEVSMNDILINYVDPACL